MVHTAPGMIPQDAQATQPLHSPHGPSPRLPAGSPRPQRQGPSEHDDFHPFADQDQPMLEGMEGPEGGLVEEGFGGERTPTDGLHARSSDVEMER